jgi:hypothetical protein
MTFGQALRRWMEYSRIKRSGLFDPAFYLLNNRDVRDADVDPLMHFVTNGWKEGRNPSASFDLKSYIEMNTTIKELGINPLIYYLNHETGEDGALKFNLKRMLIFIGKGIIFFIKLRGIVFFAGYPYPEREKDGYYQRIRSIDSSFMDRWRIYIDFIDLANREYWYDRPAPKTIVFHPNGVGQPEWIKRSCAMLCALRCRILYFHSILSMGTKYALWHIPGITKIIDIHGAVPEEFRYQGDLVNAQHFEDIEKSAVSQFQYIVVVSNAMRFHLENKYRGLIKGRFITLPIFHGISAYQNEKPYDHGKPTVIYAGGLQKWQQVPMMLDAISRTVSLYKYKFYCPEPEKVLAMLPKELKINDSLEIGSKSAGEIFSLYHECHYGFALREDIIINRVACPTKIIEYLAMGIVPIVDNENIGDFRELGMQSIPLHDLLNSFLPDEVVRKAMVKNNFEVYEKILGIQKAGIKALKQSIRHNRWEK